MKANRQIAGRAASAIGAALLVFSLTGCPGRSTGGNGTGGTGPGGNGLHVQPAAGIHLPANADPWVLTNTDLSAASHVYLGNGYVGFQAGPLGGGMGANGDLVCLVAGAYQKEGLRILPSPATYKLTLGRDVLDLSGPQVSNYRQTLDLRDGVLHTTFTWRTTDRGVPVTVTTFASRADPHLVVVHVDAPGLTDLSAAHSLSSPAAADSAGPASNGSPASGVSEYVQPPGGEGSPGIAMAAGQERSSGSDFEWTGYTVVYTTEDGPNPKALAEKELRGLTAAHAYQHLLAAHAAAWRNLWRSDITITGDAASQQMVHAGLFYLLESTRAGSHWSIPPMGLSNQAWGGHIFWDAEIWMFPALALLYPEEARPLVDYRVRLLPAARVLARAEGTHGASYPWESAATGRETAAPPYTQERHVTADVANMVWRYYLVTGDRAWLRDQGYPVLQGTADYWVSRVSRGPDGKLHIREVIGPDETAGLVNDDAFTNGAAKVNLLSAAAAARELGLQANPAWAHVAEQLVLPFDSSSGRYLTYSGYHGEIMKQADPSLLIYPLGLVTDAPTIRKELAYYPGRITRTGPAMTDSIYATIGAQQGDTAAAFAFFRHSYEPYLVPPFDQISEKHSTVRQYCFMTGLGGLLQSVLYGFGGLQVGDTALKAHPHLPAGWTKLEITNLHYRGRVYHLIATPASVALTGA